MSIPCADSTAVAYLGCLSNQKLMISCMQYFGQVASSDPSGGDPGATVRPPPASYACSVHSDQCACMAYMPVYIAAFKLVQRMGLHVHDACTCTFQHINSTSCHVLPWMLPTKRGALLLQLSVIVSHRPTSHEHGNSKPRFVVVLLCMCWSIGRVASMCVLVCLCGII